jgi:hypothetical protein|tara:strand:- start:364 stop:549 length:186 start_codon:yes stop_codon:yes gene_type:complete
MLKDRIKTLALELEKSGLNDYQMSLVTELFEINLAEQKLSVNALRKAVAFNEILTENPVFH